MNNLMALISLIVNVLTVLALIKTLKTNYTIDKYILQRDTENDFREFIRKLQEYSLHKTYFLTKINVDLNSLKLFKVANRPYLKKLIKQVKHLNKNNNCDNERLLPLWNAIIKEVKYIQDKYI